MRRATLGATLGFAAMLAFQVALAAGAPLGHAAWGGTDAQLSEAQRVGSAIGVAFYVLAILVVRRRAAGRTERRYSWTTWGLVGILGLSALMNAASSSPWERYLLAPVALGLAVLCAVVAYEASRQDGEAGSLIMDHTMLLGIEQRAEQLAAEEKELSHV